MPVESSFKSHGTFVRYRGFLCVSKGGRYSLGTTLYFANLQGLSHKTWFLLLLRAEVRAMAGYCGAKYRLSEPNRFLVTALHKARFLPQNRRFINPVRRFLVFVFAGF